MKIFKYFLYMTAIILFIWCMIDREVTETGYTKKAYEAKREFLERE